MTYFRLRDIKTPPFAYVLNKDELVQSCEACQMPFAEPHGTLEIEIFTTDAPGWERRLLGRPMMAEEWLIGDQNFRATIERLLPNLFVIAPVTVVSWLARRPGHWVTEPSEILARKDYPAQPDYFYFRPTHTLALDRRLQDSFPCLHCNRCGRDIPEIPLEYQRLPELGVDQPLVASLEHFHLEGYDYLFHERALSQLHSVFPEMLWEELATESITL